jgi:hypothetical protein
MTMDGLAMDDCVVMCCVGLSCVTLCCVVLCCVVLCCVLCCVVLCCVVVCAVLRCVVLGWVGCVVWCVWCVVVLCCVRWGACFVVMCAVERRRGAIARREPKVTVELGLCHCSRLPGKVDYQTECVIALGYQVR